MLKKAKAQGLYGTAYIKMNVFFIKIVDFLPITC